MLELNETQKEILKELKNDYKTNKKALTQIFKMVENDVKKMLKNNTVKFVKMVLEKELEMEIKSDTFYKFVKRIKKDNDINTIIKNEENNLVKENKNEVKDDEKKDVKKDLWADEKVNIMLQEISVPVDEDLKKLV